MIVALNKSKRAGLHSSVMIINGVAGKALSEQHAINSAKLLNAIQPKYLSTLVLTAYRGWEHLISKLGNDFTSLNQSELIEETKLFIETLELKETIFRSDHASNHLILKGVLGRDKEVFLEKINELMR